MFSKFKRGENKKAEDGAAADGNNNTPKKEKPEAPKPTKKKDPSPPVDKTPPGRRTVPKPATDDVVQKKTSVLVRLNYAVQQRPTEPSRSTELVPLTKDFDDMRKNLKLVALATRKYHQAMDELAKCRTDVFTKTAKLSVNSPLEDAVAAKKVVLGESLVTLDAKLIAASENASSNYQDTIIDYVTEWEAIVSKKVDSEVKYTQKLHKNLKHYEAKLEKLRKQVSSKEEKGGKAPPQMTEKLERNEIKLKDTWKEYEETATKTCHLLEEATKMGWKDLHPLIKAMIAFEYKRDTDEHALWGSLGNIKDKISKVVENHDEPLPASAFKQPLLLTMRPSSGDSGDLDLSDIDD